MYVSDGLRPVQSHVVRDADAVRASDHLPVVTDLVVD
jgi:endonuclease/exonuclease/phosphatase family metal-dependent hydrolase